MSSWGGWGDFPEPLGPKPVSIDPQLEQIIQRLPPVLDPDGGMKVHVQNQAGGGGTGDASELTLQEVSDVLGTAADVSVASPNPGTIAAYIRKIRDLLSGTLNVNVVSGVSTGLTDTQLRATPVPVSGPLSDTQLRASPVPFTASGLPLPSGASTETTVASVLTGIGAPSDAAATTTGSLIAQARRIANLLAGTLTVSGTVAVSGTVPVSGPLTDAQLRATALPVSASALPLPSGASTETTLAAVNTALGTSADAAASGAGSLNAHLRSIAAALAGTLTVTGALTDTQLRASAVPVSLASVPSHPVTNAGTFAVQDALADTALGTPADAAATTTGSVIAQLRRIANSLAGSLAVTGPLTDTQLRASAVSVNVANASLPVTGTFWQTTQPVSGTFFQSTQPISAVSLPLPAGAATETSVGLAATALGAPADAAATTTGSVIAQLRRIANLLAGTLTASISGAVAVTGTFWQATQPVSAASLPLPTGAATETSLAALLATAGATSDAAGTGAVSMNAHLRSIATALAGTLSVTGGTSSTQFAEDVPHTTGDVGTMALGVRKDTATALAGTDGDYMPMIFDASGKLHVNPGTVPVTGTFWQATQPVSAAALPLPTGAATETSLASVLTGVGAPADAAATTTGSVIAQLRRIANLLAGTLTTAISGSVAVTGTFWQATQPVSLASQPLPTGASTETTLASVLTGVGAPADAAATTTGSVIAQLRRIANQLAGSIAVTGTFWQATQPVSLASQPLPTGASTETTLASLLTTAGATADAGTTGAGTMNAHLRSIAAALAGTLTVTGGGGGTQYAEDAAHVSGDLGTQALAVRKDTATALSGSDGDYTPLITDASGRQHVNVGASVLPTGAATAAKQPALGTAGAPSTDVISIQGVSGGTPMPISGSITASGTFPIDASHAEDVAAVSGDMGVAILAVRRDAAASGVSADGDYANLSVDSSGNLRVTGGGGGTQFAEDAVHTSGDLGTMSLGVRKDTATQLAGSDGDYATFITDASGRLWVNIGTSVLPTGAATETTLAAANTAIGTTADAASSTTGTVIAHLRKIRDVLVAGLPALVSGKVPVDASGVTLTVASHAVTNAGTFATQATTELAAGLSVFSNTALSSTKTAVKASAGKLYGWMVHNPSAATAYIQVWDTAIGSITVGTTAPKYTIQIPAGASANVMSERGVTHATEINVAATTTPTGSTAPATALVVTLFYI